MIEARGLTKHYGRTRALGGVDVEVERGSCVALIGPNGAGKTTLLRILAGLVPAFDGVALIDGRDLRSHPTRVGALIEQPAVYPHLSVKANLRTVAAASGVAEDGIGALIEELGLEEASSRPAAKLSAGGRARLALAMAFLGEASVLLLDEPLAGLDPAARRRVRASIRERAIRGAAVLLASHDLVDVELVADHAVFVRDGVVLQRGSMELLTAEGRGSLEDVYMRLMGEEV